MECLLDTKNWNSEDIQSLYHSIHSEYDAQDIYYMIAEFVETYVQHVFIPNDIVKNIYHILATQREITQILCFLGHSEEEEDWNQELPSIEQVCQSTFTNQSITTFTIQLEDTFITLLSNQSEDVSLLLFVLLNWIPNYSNQKVKQIIDTTVIDKEEYKQRVYDYAYIPWQSTTMMQVKKPIKESVLEYLNTLDISMLQYCAKEYPCIPFLSTLAVELIYFLLSNSTISVDILLSQVKQCFVKNTKIIEQIVRDYVLYKTEQKDHFITTTTVPCVIDPWIMKWNQKWNSLKVNSVAKQTTLLPLHSVVYGSILDYKIKCNLIQMQIIQLLSNHNTTTREFLMQLDTLEMIPCSILHQCIDTLIECGVVIESNSILQLNSMQKRKNVEAWFVYHDETMIQIHLEMNYKYEIENSINTLMKKNRTMRWNSIVYLIKREFPECNTSMIKQRIESLLEREFIRREEQDESMYHWL